MSKTTTNGKVGNLSILAISGKLDNLDKILESIARNLITIGKGKLGKTQKIALERAIDSLNATISPLSELEEAVTLEIDSHLEGMAKPEKDVETAARAVC